MIPKQLYGIKDQNKMNLNGTVPITHKKQA